MQQHLILASSLFVILAGAAACTDTDEPRGSASAALTGAAHYRDATTDASGAPRDPARPPAQDARAELLVEGEATLTGMPTDCLDGLSGRFEARYTGEVAFTDDGAYAGGFASTLAALTTPGGCTIPALGVTAVTRVTARVSLPVTSTSCDGYCAASARADAEAACTGTADPVTCRAEAEARARASCTATCTQQATAIVAEASLGLDGFTRIDAEALRAAGFGELRAALRFDRLARP